ncbi:hypothetical protein HYPSUDRAFT_120181, partial [Hypholoma sublateritium FD-334 SS-4]
LLEDTNTEELKAEHEYPSYHFSWYNRYSKHGTGFSPDVEPSINQTEGRRIFKTSDCIPRTSEELQEHIDEYLALTKCFEDIFEWTENAVKQVLPADYEVLAQFARVLPAGGLAPGHPFTSIVINLNCATKIHRDNKDFGFCLVLVLSEDCQGGDLCFIEPGIRLELRSGDIVLFRSSELTHYNMHF